MDNVPKVKCRQRVAQRGRWAANGVNAFIGERMKFLIFIALLVSTGCSGHQESSLSATSDVAEAKKHAATFSCFDSIPRADGSKMANTQCKITSEYCLEVTGGPAISQGAHCNPLPTPDSNCADLVEVYGAGASCIGTRATGLRIDFARP